MNTKMKISLAGLLLFISGTAISQSWASVGDVTLTLNADTNNIGEGDNALIRLFQDGGAGGAYFGFYQNGGGDWQPDNLLRIGTRYGNTDHWDTMVIRTDNGNIGIGTSSPRQNLSIRDTRPRIALVDNDGDAGIIEFHETTNQIRFQKWLDSGGDFDRTIMSLSGDDGHVGIGTSNPDAKLAVNGDIHTQEVRVDLNGAVAPDYVFEPDYSLRTLAETEAYIKANKHLPEIPSAAEMKKNGIELKTMNLKLLQKVEELTLYIIALQKQVNELKQNKNE